MLRLSRKRLTPKSAKLSRRSSSASSPRWSDLTPLVLERIRDLLNSNLYDVRLRSVCSNWRRYLAHPRRPNRISDFPICLPRLPEHIQDTGTINTPMLNCSRVHKISPADDPSNGWLLKSSDATPNTFTLLSILTSERVTSNIIRSSLDLLQYQISEVCKCYRVDDVKNTLIRKVILLPHFVENIDFTVLLLLYSGEMYYFNDGDSVWSTIDVKDYKFKDVIFFKGLCYAADEKGLLVSIDSAFHLTEVLHPPDYLLSYKELAFINLVVFKSDLFLVVVVVNSKCFHQADEVHIFKWMFNGWWITSNLGKDTILLSSHEVSAAVSARDFVGCKDNCIYFSYPFFTKPYFDQGDKKIKTQEFDVYDLDEDKVLTYKRHCANMFWPPPTWMQLDFKFF